MKKKQERFDPTNVNLASQILAETDPKKIKAFGRKVNNYDDNVWNGIRHRVMLDAIILKFSQNPSLKRKLLATHPKILVEASPYDKIWGIGMTARQAIDANYQFNGLNLLGTVLMEARRMLQD
jgi:ribA/ribD-fused uncharacterized protein